MSEDRPTLASVERETRWLIAASEECARLDKAAGEYVPPMTLSEWIRTRMLDAANSALSSPDSKGMTK